MNALNTFQNRTVGDDFNTVENICKNSISDAWLSFLVCESLFSKPAVKETKGCREKKEENKTKAELDTVSRKKIIQ